MNRTSIAPTDNKAGEHTLTWDGKGQGETGTDRNSGKLLVRINPRFYRPAEVDILKGNAGKAKRELGWEPKTRFSDLVKLMVDADVQLLKDHLEGRAKVVS